MTLETNPQIIGFISKFPNWKCRITQKDDSVVILLRHAVIEFKPPLEDTTIMKTLILNSVPIDEVMASKIPLPVICEN